ncbi:alpha-2-macroglobulin family protein [Dysgonomonas reticulitermitis]
MKKHLLTGLFFLLSIYMMAQTSNNKYEAEWKQVAAHERNDLPQSAIQTVNTILEKAIADKNNMQVIKALIYKNKYKRQIDNNDNKGIFTGLQVLADQATNPSEKALLYSMLAELYLDSYNSDPWNINRRTKLVDLVPEDMDEWSSNIFNNKIIENLNFSIKEVAELKKHTTKEYDDIILIGADGTKYYPTLYDFLMDRAITIAKSAIDIGNEEFDISSTGLKAEQLILPAGEYIKLNIDAGIDKKQIVWLYYQQYMKDLSDRNLIPTLIFTEIDKAEFLRSRSGTLSAQEIQDAYIRLEKLYEKDETSIEIIDKIVNSYPYNEGDPRKINEEKYTWLKKGIQKYPKYARINSLRNQLQALEDPSLRINPAQTVMYPDTQIQLSVIYKNTQALTPKPVFKLYRVENGKYSLIKSFNPDLKSKQTYNTDTLSLSIGSLPVGSYCFSTYSADMLEKPSVKKQDTNKLDFVVSSLTTFTRSSNKDEYEIFVVDRLSGKPIEGATIKVYSSDDNKNKNQLRATLKTNDLGFAVYKDTNKPKDNWRYNIADYHYQVEYGKDIYQERGTINSNYNYRWTNSEPTTNYGLTATSIFTDRGIYRPGQTVYFKAIVLDSDSKPITNKYYTAKLYNRNNEIVSQKNITSNEYGSIAGEFTLPATGLTGSYHIEVNGNTNYFTVEEYKRPTFEVTFDKVEKTYTFGEEVKLKGYAKNFSGISLQDAGVKYTITRQQFNFWFWRSSRGSHFTDGTVKTNDDGSFEIIFTPESGDRHNSFLRHYNDRQIYTFNVTATVTDVNGETQSNNYSLNVGNVSMVIDLEIPEQMEKSEDYKLNIAAKNLQGTDIETTGTYSVYALNDSNAIQNKVLDGTFKTGEQTSLKNRLQTLTSGKYQLQVTAKDNTGNDITEKKDFVIYSYGDKKPPLKTDEWIVRKNTIFGNKPVEVIYGTSEKDRYILYQLFNNDKIFERRYVKFSEENQKIYVMYKSEYGDEVYMSFTSVSDGVSSTENILLKNEQKTTDTNLNIKLEVFRDKLRPGQEETWTISIKDKDNKPVKAELLASMYDTSLDKLYPYTAWALNRPYIHKVYLYPMDFQQSYSYVGDKWFVIGKRIEPLKVPSLTFDRINWFGYLPDYSYKDRMLSVGRSKGYVGAFAVGAVSNIRLRGVSSMDKSVAKAEVLNDSVMSNMATPQAVTEIQMDGGTSTPQIRQNFNETAFFYPQLRTNEKGETLISFTAPESNTTWRFRALAHDKGARAGTLEQMVVTRKELMVTPNMPRFIRQGDKTNISTKISNLSEGTISGEVHIEFFDPVTDKVIDLNIPNPKQSFSIEKDASTSANWTFDVPNDIELLGCRIVAQNATFSDGEQHVLAILSNRMLVTESMPIDIRKAGTSTFTMDKLQQNNSSTINNYRLTLEYASNPAWYAVQALPTMSNPTNENAVNWFASYYVNTLGSSIVRQYPKVSAMIQAWQKQGADKQTLASKLQKDEELKSVLLEETPWVLDAKDETEQMQRLSLLFDLNNTKQLTDAATRKLAELMDNKENAWSWYKGLYPSRSISQYILYGYAKLQQVGQVEYSAQIKTMQMNALKFIDKGIDEDFKNLKKYNKDWEKTTYVSTNQIEFAYVRSFYRDIPVSKEAREAERFYTGIAAKNWTKLNMYERALLSMVLKRNGDKTTANQIVKSIKENAVKDKLGMYWANSRGNVFLSMSAVSIHTFIMDALKEADSTNEEMNQMKRWLLNQKRTQVWETTHASIDAISALLSTGSDWFTGETSPATIKVGGQKVEPEKKELGTGYFKQSWDKSEINKDMAKVEIKTSGSDPAFGGLYWQYYESLDKITAQKGDLNIEKQLFKETVDASGKGLAQVTEENALTIGDKVIVRLTIKADRDMEFVHLKDMRASCFEPQQVISGIRWANSLIYYQSTKDASTNFYFDRLPKGTYVLEYPVYVNRTGEYANGITTIQCMYAPEFASHTQGIKVTVKEK